MELGMIGLGRMGGNMARRLIRAGHRVVGFNRAREPVAALEKEGGTGASSLEDLLAKLKAPRAVWVMLPAGETTEKTVAALADKLSKGDVIIDGGNTFYKDDVRRAAALKARGIAYVDCGTSGGLWGLERGYCLMVGGEDAVVRRLAPILSALAPGVDAAPRTPGASGEPSPAERGWLRCGGPGAGHFVKMVHNGIEYGLMQAYAEGFDILRGADTPARPESERYALDTAAIAELWRRGSVVGSWLLDLTASAMREDPALERYEGYVQDSGEGRWTVEAAIEQAVCAEVLATSLFARFRSRREHTFAEKVLSAMRRGFGGHVEPKKEPA